VSPSAGGVTDAMPVNGGDEALLRGLLHSLRARWPATTLTVLCHRAEDSRRILSDLHIESALECHDTTGKIGFAAGGVLVGVDDVIDEVVESERAHLRGLRRWNSVGQNGRPPSPHAQGEQHVAGIVRQPDLGLMIANDLHEIGHERLVQPERRAHVLQLGASMSMVARATAPNPLCTCRTRG
jgi:hypothetical protein